MIGDGPPPLEARDVAQARSGAEPVANAASLIVTVAACLFAAWIPASRASHVDPMKTLRQD